MKKAGISHYAISDLMYTLRHAESTRKPTISVCVCVCVCVYIYHHHHKVK